MTAMTDEKRVSERVMVFAKFLERNDWTGALLAAYNPDASTEVSYEAAKASLVADLADLSRRSQQEGWQLVPEEPTEAMLTAAGFEGEPETSGERLRRAAMIGAYRAMLAAAPSPREGK
jgi:hypothetical protein